MCDYSNNYDLLGINKKRNLLTFLKDIFSPNWKHSLAHVREKAVQNLKDQQILCRLAINDADSKVREAAAEKLNDNSLIIQVEKDAPSDARAIVIPKIDDEKLLAQIAKNDDDTTCRAAAVSKIKNEKILFQIACLKGEDSIFNSVDYRRMATKKINDKRLLSKIAKKASLSDVRMEAISRIDDQNVLIEIAKNDVYWYVRNRSVEKLLSISNDPNIIDTIVKLDQSISYKYNSSGEIVDDLRIPAIEKLTEAKVDWLVRTLHWKN